MNKAGTIKVYGNCKAIDVNPCIKRAIINWLVKTDKKCWEVCEYRIHAFLEGDITVSEALADI